MLRAILATALAVAGCVAPNAAPSAARLPAESTTATVIPMATVRYVALGDSYTIGTSVAEAERFPDQLVSRLPELDLIANLGVNGFTSRDVIEVELPKVAALKPDVVTLLIGVNDVVQDVPASTYEENAATILRELARLVGPDRIVVVTIPDYTVTPQGAAFGDPRLQSRAIRDRNAAMTTLATRLGITVVDIHDISLAAGADRSLVASDGLHPSGIQYGLWVDRIVPAMETILGR